MLGGIIIDSLKIFVGIEYGKNMEILEMKTTVYREVALNWLHLWSTHVSDGVRSVHINYEQMYTEIVDEIPMFKVFETLSEIPKD